jgi:hypothetical protein
MTAAALAKHKGADVSAVLNRGERFVANAIARGEARRG